MYGCECGYAVDAEPWSRPRVLSRDEIEALPPWTAERFENSEPVKLVADQIGQLKKRYAVYRVPDREFNPHWRGMSAIQNLGSVINTAFSVQGEELFVQYAEQPEAVHKLYDHITQLMLLCLERFPAMDGWPLKEVFVGDCTVAMISPQDYATLNYPQDHRLMELARSAGARFTIHQDSDANQQLENYAKFEYLHAFDLGQDTDFVRLASLAPNAEVNCILFPAWIESHGPEDIREELTRLMTVGKRFPRFSFTMLEMDTRLDGAPIHMFYDAFRRCARECS
jgi:uroporphyrinogen-III decarboxylase